MEGIWHYDPALHCCPVRPRRAHQHWENVVTLTFFSFFFARPTKELGTNGWCTAQHSTSSQAITSGLIFKCLTSAFRGLLVETSVCEQCMRAQGGLERHAYNTAICLRTRRAPIRFYFHDFTHFGPDRDKNQR